MKTSLIFLPTDDPRCNNNCFGFALVFRLWFSTLLSSLSSAARPGLSRAAWLRSLDGAQGTLWQPTDALLFAVSDDDDHCVPRCHPDRGVGSEWKQSIASQIHVLWFSDSVNSVFLRKTGVFHYNLAIRFKQICWVEK